MASTKQSSGTSVLKEVGTLGLDLAKTTVHCVGLDATGQVLTRRQYSKGKLLEVTAKLEPCRIGSDHMLTSRRSPLVVGTQDLHSFNLFFSRLFDRLFGRIACVAILDSGGPGRT